MMHCLPRTRATKMLGSLISLQPYLGSGVLYFNTFFGSGFLLDLLIPKNIFFPGSTPKQGVGIFPLHRTVLNGLAY